MKLLLALAITLIAGVSAVSAQSPDSPEELVVAALGHQVFTDSATGVTWYESNADFMRLKEVGAPLDSRDISDEGWLLALDSPGGDESSREEYGVLFRDGVIVGGEYTEYASGAVVQRRQVDETGEETLLERFTYRGDGTIRSVRRCDREECLTARFPPPGEGGAETIIGDSLTLLIRFSATARPEYIRIVREGAVTEEFLTYEAGELTERRVVRDETVITTTFANGRMMTEEERVQGRLVKRIENTYDQRDRLVLQVENRRNLRRETRWIYDDGNDYVMERFENEVLVLREEATGDTTIRTHFHNGNPIFRETEVAGEVTIRETFVDGAFQEDESQ